MRCAFPLHELERGGREREREGLQSTQKALASGELLDRGEHASKETVRPRPEQLKSKRERKGEGLTGSNFTGHRKDHFDTRFIS